MKIYTKIGDKGTTRLGNGVEVAKDSLSIEAIGSVDELNSLLGVILSQHVKHRVLIRKIQNELFDIGAELCLSRARYDGIQEDIVFLESKIDFFDHLLKPLKNFILPGGNSASALYHNARTVCRRAERRVISYLNYLEMEQVPHNKNIVIYLNRLSDLLFTLARYENDFGESDVIWTKKDKVTQ